DDACRSRRGGHEPDREDPDQLRDQGRQGGQAPRARNPLCCGAGARQREGGSRGGCGRQGHRGAPVGYRGAGEARGEGRHLGSVRRYAPRVAAGWESSREIAAIPSAGPSASAVKAQRQPTASTRTGTSWMLPRVSRKPAEVWSVSAVPTACRGAASVTIAL